MRLALAIASFRRPARPRRRLLQSVLPPLGAASDCVLRSGARPRQDRRRARRARQRARPRIEQIIVTSFGDTRVDRCTTCHIAIDDPRFESHAQPLKTHPYSAAHGRRAANGKWERAPQVRRLRLHRLPRRPGPRPRHAKYSHGEDEFWPEPLARLCHAGALAQGFRPKLKGKEYMEANCAQCHTERELRRHAHRRPRAASSSSP